MAKTATPTKTPAEQATIDACLAHAVAEGDLVNFQFCFISYSPLREYSSEDIHDPRYGYLLPPDESAERYQKALALVQQPDTQAHVKTQLETPGAMQLPWEPLLMLADNAVALGKYTTAAQAYELLRIREKMRMAYADEGNKALDSGDIDRAVQAYRIASGLTYDYSAFPEPMPAAPNYASKALVLHAVYPQKVEQCIALLPEDQHIQTALEYLLLDGLLADQLADKPSDLKLKFLTALVKAIDPNWSDFVANFKATCKQVQESGGKLQQMNKPGEDEAATTEGLDAELIPATLLGRNIEHGAWWQYLKELAYSHPASILFLSRQMVTQDLEIVMPRLLHGSAVVEALGLTVPGEAASEG